MNEGRKLFVGAIALLIATATLLPTNTRAVTAEVAKRCNALMVKEFPPRVPGNPAAGSAKGNGQAARDYFKKCVDNGGNMDRASDKNTK